VTRVKLFSSSPSITPNQFQVAINGVVPTDPEPSGTGMEDCARDDIYCFCTTENATNSFTFSPQLKSGDFEPGSSVMLNVERRNFGLEDFDIVFRPSGKNYSPDPDK